MEGVSTFVFGARGCLTLHENCRGGKKYLPSTHLRLSGWVLLIRPARDRLTRENQKFVMHIHMGTPRDGG